MLVRLIYASRAAAAVNPEGLLAIFRQSKQNNPRLGITGLLCHSDGVFMQALEGGRDAVNQLYHRIAADTRHGQMLLLSYEEIAERRFACWAMGQVDLSRLNPALLLKYSATTKLDPSATSALMALAMFEELAATASIMTERG